MSTSKLISNPASIPETCTELEPQLTVGGISIQVVRKPIKNLHLAVYPPDGQVRISAPLHLSDDNIRLAVVARLSWIKKQQAKLLAQPRQSKREMVTGESHYVFGKRCRLEVIERRGRHEIIPKNNTTLLLYVNAGTSQKNQALVLNEWYRSQLKIRVAPLIDHWQSKIEQPISNWGIRKMKTKWGSCNIAQRRILLNLELAKKPPECLEYVIVHELVHLLERKHGDRFKAYLDHYFPQWRVCRDALNREPLSDI